ncbi:TIGR00282 family metallophosphoesterase [Candidatus Pelagibacter sp.]|nr:TIGR00282 family metallophosphoesterase [Candidatus Pelagibacter sp.]
MNILFLGDIVGDTGCKAVKNNLPEIIKSKNIDFVCVNGENAASEGVGLTENIANELFNAGVDVITTGNHVWDQKEILDFIKIENKLLRPLNLIGKMPGNGFNIYNSKKNLRVGVLNLMGNIFMKKCEDVFKVASEFLLKKKIKRDYDFLIVDFHGEITSEKMAMGNLFDGHATLVVGTHTHVPTNDARILKKGTGYMTDAGMCGDYNSVIGMDVNNSLNRFLKKGPVKNFPANGEASLSGIIVECNKSNGLAKNMHNFILGGTLKNTN